MDREYLEEYWEKEKSARAQYNRLIAKELREEKWPFETHNYPPDERFPKLQKPIANAEKTNIWAQVPFSGSLIVGFLPCLKPDFERFYFKVSEIPKVLDFIKDTGRLQIALAAEPPAFEGLDHYDLFFEELKPPLMTGVPMGILGNKKERQATAVTFYTLGKGVRDYIRKNAHTAHEYKFIVKKFFHVYMVIKLTDSILAETSENLMVDDPAKAVYLLRACEALVTNPFMDLRCDLRNFSLSSMKKLRILPSIYQPNEIRFPCEIGKFLLKKVTYGAQNLRACYYLIDQFDRYDLQKVQESLNEAIVANHPDIVNKSIEELSEIIDNLWNDKTIPKRKEMIRIGLPISIAAIGGVAGGLPGLFAGGFLAGLGFKVAEKTVDKFLSVKGEGLSEKLAKLRTKSYQTNVYDFKKKYMPKFVP